MPANKRKLELQTQPQQPKPDPIPQPNPHKTKPVRAFNTFIAHNTGREQNLCPASEKENKINPISEEMYDKYLVYIYKFTRKVGVIAGGENLTKNSINNSTNVRNLNIFTQVIGRYAFYNRRAIQRIYLNRNLKIIEDYAFGKCINLRYIRMYDGIEKIGANVFAYCLNIIIKFEGTKKQWLNIQKHPDWAKDCISIVVECLDGTIKY